MFKKISGMDIKLLTDNRGVIYDFSNKNIKNLHLVTMEPGTVRGNHSHKMAEWLKSVLSFGC